jgi:hypothetical protein
MHTCSEPRDHDLEALAGHDHGALPGALGLKLRRADLTEAADDSHSSAIRAWVPQSDGRLKGVLTNGNGGCMHAFSVW